MMTMIKRLLTTAGVLLLAAHVFAFQAPAGQTPPGQSPPAQGEFIPIDQLPPAAYAFVWVAVFFYVWTVWRRLNKVEADIRSFEQRHPQQIDPGPGTNRTGAR
jgi:CcmD family protein